jgi:uncharacterized protein (TIGR02145 family)
MKTIITLSVSCLIWISLEAQVPQAFNYQAVARDLTGSILANQTVSFRISILKNTISGTVVYSETHSGIKTNAFGLVDLKIGKGIVYAGNFTTIDWGGSTNFIKIEMDPLGGTAFQDMGTTQLLSVPYALYSLQTDLSEFKKYLDSLLHRIEVLEGTKIKDIDNNLYKTVTIGTQVWMAENLRTTRYNNGTVIPKVTDNSTWDGLITGAWCWYNNDSASFENPFGKLYNWFAVNTGILCPAGWHVPTDAEWTVLEDFMSANGYNYDGTITGNKIGKSLAATTSWESSSVTGATGNTDYPAYRNKSGFTSLPGGYRFSTGAFYDSGRTGYWWSSLQAPTSTYGWLRYQRHDFVSLTRISYQKLNGYSVRCLKN